MSVPGHQMQSVPPDAVWFDVPPLYRTLFAVLPWTVPLADWNEEQVDMIPVKSGLSRHVVRFISCGGQRFAIKETTVPAARREFDSYVRLAALGIPTLRPIGIVARNDGAGMVQTRIGTQPEERRSGFLVTILMERVIPDSFLYKLGFSPANRNRIWDAVVDLFVQLHSNGVYWGDASLANMLVNFHTEQVPGLGRRQTLRAILADAETVELRPSISDRLRLADVEFFLESMQWTAADLQASGIVHDEMLTREDQQYIAVRYREQFAVALEMRSFELLTHIDIDKLLGDFDVKGYGKVLLHHIQEHRWYLGERTHRAPSITEAAEQWYREIFRPVCRVFNECGLLHLFPDRTAASLYVEIMTHKYLVSQRVGHDVGLVPALEDYCMRFSNEETRSSTVGSILTALNSLYAENPDRDFLYH